MEYLEEGKRVNNKYTMTDLTAADSHQAQI